MADGRSSTIGFRAPVDEGLVAGSRSGWASTHSGSLPLFSPAVRVPADEKLLSELPGTWCLLLKATPSKSDHTSCLFTCRCPPPINSRNKARPLCSCDFDVPTDLPLLAAISLCPRPSMSCNTIACRYPSGSFAITSDNRMRSSTRNLLVF